MNTITREVTASTRITSHCITASRHHGMDESGFGLDKLHENYIWYMVYTYIQRLQKNYIDNLYSTEIGKQRVCISYMVFVHKQSKE